MTKQKVHVFWRVPGSVWSEGPPNAKAIRSVGGTVRVTMSTRWPAIHRRGKQDLTIYHHDNWGDERFPWRLTHGSSVENQIVLDEFPSLKEALADAKRRAREKDFSGGET